MPGPYKTSTVTPVVHLKHLTTLQATRAKLEAASAAAHPIPPAQGKLEAIADRVKQRRYLCAVTPAVHFNVGYFVTRINRDENMLSCMYSNAVSELDELPVP